MPGGYPQIPGVNQICCSNALIYFIAKSQEQNIDLCAFSLYPSGLLEHGWSASIVREQVYSAVEEIDLIYDKMNELNYQSNGDISQRVRGYSYQYR